MSSVIDTIHKKKQDEELIDFCTDKMLELAGTIDEIWHDYYKSGVKWDKIHEAIEEFNEKYGDICGVEASAKPKGISTHLSRWTGWRQTRYGDPQYCMPWYGGYVYCVVFDIEDPALRKKYASMLL